MASFGAKYPCFAPFGETQTAGALPKYGTKVVIGELVKADLTVNLASGDIYGDDRLIEMVSEFSSGSIAMETVDMLDDVATVVYGATKAASGGEVTYAAGDEPPFGGLAYYKVLMRAGEKVYKGYYYPKVKAALGNDSAQTKGNSITFGTTNTTFTVFEADTGAWRVTKEFDTETAVKSWVDTQLTSS